MRNFFKNRCVFSLIIVVVIIGIIFGAVNALKTKVTFVENIAEVIFTPVQKFFTGIGSGASQLFGYFSDIDALKAENRELKDKNEELSNKVKLAESSQTENDELRNLLGLREGNPEYELECAEIVARDPSNWYSTLTVDKGSADGITENMPVISKGKSLVGRVSEVGSTWAKIITLTDPEHGAGASVLRSGDFCIIEGDSALGAEGNCRLSFVSKNSNIVVGDTISTSGLGGIYPKGLIIGRVMEIRPEIQGISQYAVVKPEVDINDLHAVFIVKNSSTE